MINPLQRNQDPWARGFDKHRKPQGYGQLSGASPFLDRAQPDEGDTPQQRVLASDPGISRPMIPPRVPAYMQALDSGDGDIAMAPRGNSNEPSAFQQALMQGPAPRPQPSAPSVAPGSGTRTAATIAPPGAMRNMSGFDQRNWDDPEMDSVKYGHGRLANGIVKPSEMAALVASEAYQARFPGATFDGKDRVHFQGAASDGRRGGVPVGSIDVLRAADKDADTSEGGDWMPIEEGGGAAAAAPQETEEQKRLRLARAQQSTGGVDINNIIDQLVAEQASGNRSFF